VISSARPTYTSHPDTNARVELDALKAIYSRALQKHQECKKAEEEERRRITKALPAAGGPS
jgi:hypothetical protein